MDSVLDKLLMQNAGKLHDEAVFNLIEELRYARTLPRQYKLIYARFALRTINAVIPYFDIRIDQLLALAEFEEFDVLEGFRTLYCADRYTNESPQIKIRLFLSDISEGLTPLESKKRHNIYDEEFLLYKDLLKLDEYWQDCLLDRVIFILENNGKFIDVYKELKGFNLRESFKYFRLAKKILKELYKK